jgi:hypothetical protein
VNSEESCRYTRTAPDYEPLLRAPLHRAAYTSETLFRAAYISETLLRGTHASESLPRAPLFDLSALVVNESID